MKNNTMTKKKNKMKNPPRKPGFSTSPAQELKKVTWPNRDTLVKSTFLILIICIITTLFISIADYLLAKGFLLLREIKNT